MSLQTPAKIRKLQKALHAKAKESPSYRFYLLYDKLYRPDILDYAFRLCRAKRGAAGVDAQSFEAIGRYGTERWLGELAEELRRWLLLDADKVVQRLHKLLIGWSNYFMLGPVSKAYKAVDRHSTDRLRRWLCCKHKQPGRGTARYPNEYLYQSLGLARLEMRTQSLPWAKT